MREVRRPQDSVLQAQTPAPAAWRTMAQFPVFSAAVASGAFVPFGVSVPLIPSLPRARLSSHLFRIR